MLGVLAAGAFCYALFMILFIAGSLYLAGPESIAWPLLGQHFYLQMLQMMILTAACFLLSLSCTRDAALVLACLLFFASGLISSMSVSLYPLTNAVGRLCLILLTYLLPQLAVFDLSAKVLHKEIWSPLEFGLLMQVTLYGALYVIVFSLAAHALFRRRPL